MSTYQDTLARLQAQMQNHSEMALERLARKIIIALEAQMKDEEIAQELTIEQPHYRSPAQPHRHRALRRRARA